ncbi:DUF445 domain-containing protein [Alteribacter natronophilus]|uniref:DUF445 domain-containing protein n=1 Tax=Alteribacter natronophilus TaxID=2583810 RepID=UPI0014875AA8|nr:DUF445 family protein [Alteribacter natronophilus]
MEILTVIALMILIGAFIGGLTNLIAIRMLFRPFNPIYVGKMQLPFTPGLIPKRRAELAEQLGSLVTGHLITVEGVKSKLFDETLIREIRTWFGKKVKEVATSEDTLEEWWRSQAGGAWSPGDTRLRFTGSVQQTLMKTLEDYRSRPAEEWLPDSLIQRADEKIPEVTTIILKKGKEFVRSPEGKQKIEEMVSRYFSTKGSFGGMVGRMMSNVPVSGRIQHELLRLLDDEKAREFIETRLRTEWREIISKSPDELAPGFDWEKRAAQVADEVASRVPVLGEWEQPLGKWAHRYEARLTDTLMPAVLETLSAIIERNLQRMLQNLKIDEIVRDQVNSFPLPRLEQVILSIAKKELKMIALLGAVIGGTVGLIQGLIVVVIL